MALTVGDVVYKIGADVSGLNKAVSQLNKFKKSITEIEAAAKKTKASLSKGFVINVSYSKLAGATKALDTLSASANKARKAISSLSSITVNYSKTTGAIKALDKLSDSADKAKKSFSSLSSKSISLNVVSKGTKEAISDLTKLESKLASVARKAKALNIDVSSSMSKIESASMAVARGYSIMGTKGDKVFVQQKKQLASLIRQYEAFKARQQLAGLPGGIGANIARSINELKEQVDLYDEAYSKYKKYTDILAAGGQLKGNQLVAFENAKRTMEELRRGALNFDEFNDKIINMQNSLAKANNEFKKVVNSQKLLSKVELEKAAAATKIDELKRQFAYLKASPKLIEQADAAYQKLASTLDAMAKKGATTAGAMAKAKAEFQRTFTVLSREAKVLEKGMTRTTVVLGNFIQGIKSVGTAYAAFLVFQGLQDAVTGFFRISDATKLLRARIRQVTKDVDEFNNAWSGIFRIAERTRGDFEAIGKLYFRVAAAVRPLGRSQEEVLKVTETVSAALLAGGASAQEAASATLQLSQAFAKGKLDGDELRAVLENAQVLTAAMGRQFGIAADDAKSMTGVIIEMARRGELTIDKFFDAILKSHGEMMSLIGTVPVTMGQAWTLLKNRLAIVIDKFQQATDWSGKLAEAIKFLALNVEKLVVAFGALAGVAAFRALSKGAKALKRDAGDSISSVKTKVLSLATTIFSLNAAKDVFFGLGRGTEKFARAFISLKTAKEVIRSVFGALAKAVRLLKALPIGRLITPLIAGLSAIGTALTVYKDKVVDVVGETEVTVGDYATAIVKFFRYAISQGIDKAKAAWDDLKRFFKTFTTSVKKDFNDFINFYSNSFIGDIIRLAKDAGTALIEFFTNLIPRSIISGISAFQIFKRVITDSSYSIGQGIRDLIDEIAKIWETDYAGKAGKDFLENVEKGIKNAKNAATSAIKDISNTFRQAAAAEARLRKNQQQQAGFGGLTRRPDTKPAGLSEQEVKALDSAVKAYLETLRQMRIELAAISSIPTGQWAQELNAAFGADWVNRYVSAVVEVKNTFKDLNQNTWPEFKKKVGASEATLEEFINAQIRLRLSLDASRKKLQDTTQAFQSYKDIIRQANVAQREAQALLSGGPAALEKVRRQIEVEDLTKNVDLGVLNKQLAAEGLSPVSSIEEFQKRLLQTKQQISDFQQLQQMFEELMDPIDRTNMKFDQMREVILRTIPASDEMRQKMLENLEKMRQKALESVDPMAQLANQIGDAFGRAFEDAIVEGKKFSDVLKQLEKDILRLVTRKLVTEPLSDFISGAVKSGFGGFFKNLFGFAHGGQFKVGGVGGTDSQLVAFWATPGETVTVTPPGQSPVSGMNVTININTPTGTVDPQSLGQIQAALARATQRGARNL